MVSNKKRLAYEVHSKAFPIQWFVHSVQKYTLNSSLFAHIINLMNCNSNIFSPEIRKVWEDRKTITTNLNEIGIGWDANKVIKIPNARSERMKTMKKVHGFTEEDSIDSQETTKQLKRPKAFVMEDMEMDANALRESNFR